MLPKVSFVIPALNAQKTLSKTIQSIKHQDYPHELFEILVINNGSTDLTASIAEKEGAKVIDVTPKNRSLARNTGFKNANFELIAFIDADVSLDRSWLKEMVLRLDHDSIAGGQGQIIPIHWNTKSSFEKFRNELSTWRTYKTFNSLRIVSVNTPMVNTAACLYRKSILQEVDGFDEVLNRHEDIDLSKRISRLGYHFIADENAKAFVAWSGEGWIDYLFRSFDVGFTRKSFEQKWKLNQSLGRRILKLGSAQLKNLQQLLKTKDIFWVQKALVEIVVELGRFVSFKSFSGSYKIPESNQDLSLVIFSDRVHAIHLKTQRVFELETYHAFPLLTELGLMTVAECNQKMAILMGEEYDPKVLSGIVRELIELGILSKGKYE